MTLVEISEREVLSAAKVWARGTRERGLALAGASDLLMAAVCLLEERERVAENLNQSIFPEGEAEPVSGRGVPFVVNPRAGAEPIPRQPRSRKLSRRQRAIEERRASDPMGRDRPEIDYSSDELPSVR